MIDPRDIESFRHFDAHPEDLPRRVNPREYPPDPKVPNWKHRQLNRAIAVFAVIVVAIFLTMTARGVGLGSNAVFLNVIGWILLIAIAGLLISVILQIATHLHTPNRE